MDAQLDVSGNEVRVGDLVAFTQPSYSSLKVAKVVKITRKGVTLDVTRPRWQWHGSQAGSETMQLNRSSSQISKVQQ